MIFTQQSNNWSSRMDTNTDAKGGNKTDAEGGEDAQALHQEAGRQRPTDRRLSFGFPAGSSTPAQQQAAAELSNALAATELIVNKSKAQTGGLHVLNEEEYLEKAWDFDAGQDDFSCDGGGDEDEDDDEGDWLEDLAGEASMDDAVKELTENNTSMTAPTKPHSRILACIDMAELNPRFREVGRNNVRSLKQAADWFRKTDKDGHLDALVKAGKEGGRGATKAIQETMSWLYTDHRWQTTEAIALVCWVLTEHVGKTGHETSDTVASLIETFCWECPGGMKRFRLLTTRGEMTQMEAAHPGDIKDAAGYKWLDPGQIYSAGGRELHHSRAWLELLKGIQAMIDRRKTPVVDAKVAFAKWLSAHFNMTVMGEQVKGTWKRQASGQSIVYKLNEERQNFSELIKSLEHHDLMELKPGPKTRVANMMTIPMLKTVKELQKELREARPEPIPMTAVTYDMAVQKLCKIDERRDETYWVEDGGLPPSHGDKPKEEQKLSKLEMRARANFARTHKRDWRTVTMTEVNAKGVKHWAERSFESPSSHNGAKGEELPEPKPKKKMPTCRFHKMGHCKKGDQCDFSHASTPQEGGNRCTVLQLKAQQRVTQLTKQCHLTRG